VEVVVVVVVTPLSVLVVAGDMGLAIPY